MLKFFKRWLPALLAALAFFSYYRYTTVQQQHTADLATAVRVGALNADAAVIAETANTAVPPFGLVAGKLAFGLAAFLAVVAVVWFTMRLVTPVLVQWATGHYTAGGEQGQPDGQQGSILDFKLAFLSLDPAGRLRVFVTVWLGLLALGGVCVLAACLVS